MEVLEGNPKYSGYVVVQRQLLYKGRIVLPQHSKLIPSLLQEFHNSLVGGHLGLFKTMQRLAVKFYWPRMKQDMILWLRVQFVSKPNTWLCHQQVYSNLSQYLIRCGTTSPWILSKDYHNLRGLTLFWQLLTG